MNEAGKEHGVTAYVYKEEMCFVKWRKNGMNHGPYIKIWKNGTIEEQSFTNNKRDGGEKGAMIMYSHK